MRPSFNFLGLWFFGCNPAVCAVSLLKKGARTKSVASATESGLDDVIQILSQMLKDLNTQADEDKTVWQKYSTWSDQTEEDKHEFLRKQKGLEMASRAMLNANKQMRDRLTVEIGEIAGDIAQTSASLRDLKEMRHEEQKSFANSLADLETTIKAVEKAGEILEGHYKGKGALLQEVQARVQMALRMYSVKPGTEYARAAASLLSLVRGDQPDFASIDGDKAYGSYKGNTDVVSMLKDLQSQLLAQKEEVHGNEAQAKSQYESTRSSKQADLKQLKAKHEEKISAKEEAASTITRCGIEIQQAEKEIADADSFLSSLVADRDKFSQEFSLRLSTRQDELAATQAALDALQAISAGAKSSVLLGVSLMQIKNKKGQRLRSTLASLQLLGKKLGNMALIDASLKVLHKEALDPDALGPVKKLLGDLIGRLEAENGAETSQHEWCSEEKDTAVARKAEKEKSILSLKASVEAGTTKVATIKDEIQSAEQEIQRVQSEDSIAKSLRDAEHKVFLAAKSDHEEVIAAVDTALSVLKKQYGLIQTGKNRGHQEPSSPFEDYASGSDSGGSAVEMLQDLSVKYKNALKGIESDEKSAQEAHDALLMKNALFIADTTSSVQSKTAERRQRLNDLAENKEELKTDFLELHEVAIYLRDLRPSCDDIRSTYEERSKRREAEISALKEALDVLEDPTALFE